ARGTGEPLCSPDAQAAGRAIRPRSGAGGPFGSLDGGGGGLVVGDDPPWGCRVASLPVGRRPAPAPPPPAALGCPWLILEEGRPRRKPASARPAPATTAVVQTRTPHGAGIAIGATAGGGGVPPRAVASPRLAI